MAGLNIILDVVTAAVLIGFIISGVRRGFVMTMSTFLVVILAYIGAGIAARLLSPFAAGLIEPLLRGIELPEILSEETLAGLNIAGVNIGSLGLVEGAADALNAGAAQVADAIVSSVARTISYAAVAMIAFVALTILLKLAFRAMNLVTKLPVLNTLNTVLGLVFGIAAGIIVMIVLAWLLGLFSGYITADTVGRTLVYKYFASPPKLLQLFR